MLTYTLVEETKESLYAQLYRFIRQDIASGKLKSQEKLPSKRSLAKHLGVSTITVEGAYAQLVAEGYLYTQPKKGYFVSPLTRESVPLPVHTAPAVPLLQPPEKPSFWADLASSAVASDMFPFSLWLKLLRDVTAQENETTLLTDTSAGGVFPLRQAIAAHLYQFRGMTVDPAQVVVGAGTEYLYSVLIQLLGREEGYAVEDPGYLRLGQIYERNNVRTFHIPMDQAGVIPAKLEESGANILHITPSHHFPTGIVMPIRRRYDLLRWVEEREGRYIIEDDYDCEFRLSGRPIPTLQSIDEGERVIYINTFSKSLAPAFRISYLVLPPPLVRRFYETLGFYSGTVSCLEQMTLARFLSQGHFEKHINRMRSHYRGVQDRLLTELRKSPLAGRMKILGENAGLHFLLELEVGPSDQEIVQAAEQVGLRLSFLSQYHYRPQPQGRSPMVLSYAGLDPEKIPEAVARLCQAVLGESLINECVVKEAAP